MSIRTISLDLLFEIFIPRTKVKRLFTFWCDFTKVMWKNLKKPLIFSISKDYTRSLNIVVSQFMLYNICISIHSSFCPCIFEISVVVLGSLVVVVVISLMVVVGTFVVVVDFLVVVGVLVVVVVGFLEVEVVSEIVIMLSFNKTVLVFDSHAWFITKK